MAILTKEKTLQLLRLLWLLAAVAGVLGLLLSAIGWQVLSIEDSSWSSSQRLWPLLRLYSITLSCGALIVGLSGYLTGVALLEHGFRITLLLSFAALLSSALALYFDPALIYIYDESPLLFKLVWLLAALQALLFLASYRFDLDSITLRSLSAISIFFALLFVMLLPLPLYALLFALSIGGALQLWTHTFLGQESELDSAWHDATFRYLRLITLLPLLLALLIELLITRGDEALISSILLYSIVLLAALLLWRGRSFPTIGSASFLSAVALFFLLNALYRPVEKRYATLNIPPTPFTEYLLALLVGVVFTALLYFGHYYIYRYDATLRRRFRKVPLPTKSIKK